MMTLKECLDLFDEVSRPEAIESIQLDAQKHGEQIGWKKGMTDAAEISLGNNQTLMVDRITRNYIADEIITARDSKKEI